MRPARIIHNRMKILLPFSWIYMAIMAIRNLLFDIGWLKQSSFPIPIISVGNLAVGGTGKTPHTEYLVNLLHQQKLSCGVLSRGYGRSTKGYLEVKGKDAHETGDEPWQIQNKYPDAKVCVCENRCQGIRNMLAQYKNLQVMILDDAYQHRYVKPGFSILLTDYSRLYCDDHVMPAGRLREHPRGAQRAQFIVVTKCPEHLSPSERALIEKRLHPLPQQQVLFSKMVYGNIYPLYAEGSWITQGTQENAPITELHKYRVLLVCGIARPQPFINYIQKLTSHIDIIDYADHHPFTTADIHHITQRAKHADIVITTEKDASKFATLQIPQTLRNKLCVQPIAVEFLDNDSTLFHQTIIRYVTESQGNSPMD